MKRLDGNVGAIQSPLEQAPEILEAIDVDLTAHVLLNMGNGFADELPRPQVAQAIVSGGLIGVDGGLRRNILEDFGLQHLTTSIWDYFGPHLPSLAVKHSHHSGLGFGSEPILYLDTASEMHILWLAPNGCLIHLDRATTPAQLGPETFLQSQPDPMQHKPSGFLGY